jgi:hypothetical protein
MARLWKDHAARELAAPIRSQHPRPLTEITKGITIPILEHSPHDGQPGVTLSFQAAVPLILRQIVGPIPVGNKKESTVEAKWCIHGKSLLFEEITAEITALPRAQEKPLRANL